MLAMRHKAASHPAAAADAGESANTNEVMSCAGSAHSFLSARDTGKLRDAVNRYCVVRDPSSTMGQSMG